MDVSIIIVNYHSEKLIRDCVESIVRQTSGLSYEIIVVDNASSDEGKEVLKTCSDQQMTVIDAGGNLGFGKANNLGAKYAKGKYLFILNPDTILMNNAIKMLFDYMESSNNIGVCGGNLFAPDGEPVPSFCREFDTLDKEKKDSAWLSIIAKKVEDVLNRKKQKETDEFNYSDKPEEVAYIFGADMFLRRELFDSIGGFDRDFFMYAEEAELQKRISDMGYRIVCIPQSHVIHLEGATSNNSLRQFSMRIKGKLTYFNKCFPPNGAALFYKYRRLRMMRQMKWQRLRGRNPNTEAIDILDQVYEEYCSERRN